MRLWNENRWSLIPAGLKSQQNGIIKRLLVGKNYHQFGNRRVLRHIAYNSIASTSSYCSKYIIPLKQFVRTVISHLLPFDTRSLEHAIFRIHKAIESISECRRWRKFIPKRSFRFFSARNVEKFSISLTAIIRLGHNPIIFTRLMQTRSLFIPCL